MARELFDRIQKTTAEDRSAFAILPILASVTDGGP